MILRATTKSRCNQRHNFFRKPRADLQQMVLPSTGTAQPRRGSPHPRVRVTTGLLQELYIPPNKVQTLVWLEGSHDPFIFLDSPQVLHTFQPPTTLTHTHTHTHTHWTSVCPHTHQSFKLHGCLYILSIPSEMPSSSPSPEIQLKSHLLLEAFHDHCHSSAGLATFRESPQVLLPSLSRL